MTLYLSVHRITELKQMGVSDVYLFVNGSQSGSLRSQPGPGGYWMPEFEIICANNDQLTIQAYEDPKGRAEDLIGQTRFHAASFIKNNRALTMSQQVQTELNLEKDEKDAGILSMRVRYDKAQKYEGQLPSALKIDIQDSHKKKPITFYKGKCKTTNLFSWLDTAAQGQQFKAVESFYRDEQN